MQTVITKKTKIHEVNNSMCWNFYYLINFRCVNADNTKYKKGKFVIWFDIFDIQEYYEDEEEEKEQKGVSKEQFNEYVNELAYNFIEDINFDNFGQHIPRMQETIDNYNKIA